MAAVGELSQDEEGELGLQFLVVGGPAIFLVDIKVQGFFICHIIVIQGIIRSGM